MESSQSERVRARADDAVARLAKGDRPSGVVGIGASAGGLEAFNSFFDAMSPDSGLAFVLILHLSPTSESMLAELVAKHTKLPVQQVVKPTPVAANNVYVIPPGASLIIDKGVLHLVRPEQERFHRQPIDAFFRSLAADQGSAAVAIILSGSGSDGTVGLKTVKEQGGITIAQKKGAAQFNEMPEHAIATGLVDHVLDVEDMPAVLTEWAAHRERLDEKLGADGLHREAAKHLDEVCAILRNRTGNDFSHYKTSTIIRRLLRRLHVSRLESVSAYVARLRDDGEEVAELFKDLLIGVTHFFRDSESFSALESNVIQPLLKGRGAGDRVRIWVPGCSSGEEAYTIAMLIHENLSPADGAPDVQIFATDIDEEALSVGRAGRYSRQSVEPLSPERLARFFTQQGSSYYISKSIRERVLFAAHSIIRDPPFSRLDLISCRNLLIYMERDLQKRVIPLLHYALDASGYLFVGPSENVTSHANLFRPIDRGHGIYQRKSGSTRATPELPLSPVPHYRDRIRATGKTFVRPAVPRHSQSAERLLLREFGPASVVVDEQGHIVEFIGRTGRYLEPPAGAPTTNLYDMARRELRVDLRALMRDAVARRGRVERACPRVATTGGERSLSLVAMPLPDRTEVDLFLIAFIEQERAGGPKETKATDAGEQTNTRAAEHLERELEDARNQLQTTIEVMEGSNEELKMQGEELMSMNEELQSSNEELETSREELQSLNEELETVNSELHNKVVELSQANSDLENLLRSTRIATVFLDSDLCIRMFTPAATQLFRLIDSDMGRPITDIAARFDTSELLKGTRDVLRTLESREQLVHVADDDSWHMMRVFPCTLDSVVNGAVITFSDVTELKRTEAKLRFSEERFLLAMKSVPLALACVDKELCYTWAYDPGIDVFPKSLVGQREQQITRRGSDGDLPDVLQKALETGVTVTAEISLELHDERRTLDVVAEPLHDSEGAVSGVGCAALDVTNRKDNERLSMLLAELNHRVKNTLATVISICSQTAPTAKSPEEFQKAFEARLHALSAVHNLLTRAQWSHISLRELIGAPLRPYVSKSGENIELEGPEVRLDPSQALTLGMVFNELATNAAKYGALSTSAGRVKIHWTTGNGEDRRLRVDWEESGGPGVVVPSEHGFGLNLVQDSVPYELRGEVNVEFRPSGLCCTLLLPDPTRNPNVSAGPRTVGNAKRR